MNLDAIWNEPLPAPARSDYHIGVIGAGFIVRDIQLVAYRNAGFSVAAIASHTPENARAAAALRGIPRIYETFDELLEDPSIEILDIAIPPAHQIGVIRKAVAQKNHIRGILAQKPLAMNYAEACESVRLCDDAGVHLAVNQNMRYDPSIRALRALLCAGYLGEPVLATIEMRAVPHWQKWLHESGKLTLLNMSIHHLDCLRFLFGNPDSAYCSARPDPRTSFPHRDGICLYILEYADGMRASAWDDTWAGPGRNNEDVDAHIKWRVEGTEGVAQGTIGWPGYPNRTPSTIEFTSVRGHGYRYAPLSKKVWFPDAFEGPMAALMHSIATGEESEISGRDNLHTMALVDACYRSLEEHRPVRIDEIEKNA